MQRRKELLIIGLLASAALVPMAASASLIYGGFTGGQSSASGLSSATNIGLMAGVSIPFVPFLYVEGAYQRISNWNGHVAGLAVVLRLPLAPSVAIIGKIGGAQVSTAVNGVSASAQGPLYGGGISVRISGPFSIRAEYQVVRALDTDFRTTQGDLIYHF
jgi:opacity protein-like surface antigen